MRIEQQKRDNLVKYLSENEDQYVAVKSDSGTGKTFSLESIKENMSSDRYRNNFYCEDCGNFTFYSDNELESYGCIQCSSCGQSSIS